MCAGLGKTSGVEKQLHFGSFFSGCFEPLKKDLKKNKIKFNESLISPSFDELHCHKTKIIIFHFRHGGGTHFLVLDIYCYPVTRKTQIMLQNRKVFIFSSPCCCFEKEKKIIQECYMTVY